MKAAAARKLVGKPVKYRRTYGDYVHPWQYATILDVKGRNVLVEKMGMTDWLWLPDLILVEVEA
jgi:hypothetical protein